MSSCKDFYSKTFKETLTIIKNNGYMLGNSEVYDLNDNLKTYIVKKQDVSKKEILTPYVDSPPKFLVVDQTTVEAILENQSKSNKMGVLNFSKSNHLNNNLKHKNPTQEETLLLSSNLHKSLLSCNPNYFEDQRTGNVSLQDSLIVSKNVVIFRDTCYRLLKKKAVVDTIISCPAVNLAEVIKCNLDSHSINLIMEQKIRLIINQFIIEGVDTLILGAFGCGTLSNKPYDVARIFKKILITEKLGYHFNLVVFAIPRREVAIDYNFESFKNTIR